MDSKQRQPPLVPEDLLRGHPDVVPAMARKTHATEGGGPKYVLSDESLDRHGDQILASGWDLREFKKNSICLFNHRADFPVGRWADVRVEGTALVGRLELHRREHPTELMKFGNLSKHRCLPQLVWDSGQSHLARVPRVTDGRCLA